MCLSLGLPRAGEGLGYRQGMLFKTKKEMLAQNGKERKQLPVSGAGLALSSPLVGGGRPGLAGATPDALDAYSSHCLRSRK